MSKIIKTKWILRFPKYNTMAYYYTDSEAEAKKLAEKIAFDSLFDFWKKESWTEHEIVKISCTDDKIIVNGKCKRIVYDSEWAYKVQKTQIKSNRNAVEFLEELTKDSSKTALSCMYIKIIENIEKEGKTFVA